MGRSFCSLNNQGASLPTSHLIELSKSNRPHISFIVNFRDVLVCASSNGCYCNCFSRGERFKLFAIYKSIRSRRLVRSCRRRQCLEVRTMIEKNTLLASKMIWKRHKVLTEDYWEAHDRLKEHIQRIIERTGNSYRRKTDIF